MLSEFIQLNVFKSQPNFNNFRSQQSNNAQFSLQIPKRSGVCKDRQNQNLRGRVFNRLHQDTEYQIMNNNQFQAKNQPLKYKNFIENHPEFQRPIRLTEPNISTQNTENIVRKPLIVSPCKPMKISNEKYKIFKPLIQNQLIQSNPKTSNQKIYQGDPQNTSLSAQKIPLIRSVNSNKQNKLLYSNQQYNGESSTKKCLFKSLTHQNLSPLKHKPFKMSNLSSQSYSRRNDSSSKQKRALERSNSFKKAIQSSRSKHKQLRENNSSNKLIDQINRQYYDIGTKKIKQQNNFIASNFNLKSDRIIKNPSLKKGKVLQEDLQKLKNTQIQEKFSNRDSFNEEIVNNSTMNSFIGQDSKCLNMEPF